MGDTINFLKEPELKQKFNAKVIGLLNYSSFTELFKDFDISMLSDKSMNKAELLNVLQEFYTLEKQNTYCVLGIKI